ncbi:MAG: hypothetical protein IJD02_02820 [Lachnospiraceae bacterium]|nr:hypothetical protein [Lachnospiraceae bacterium]
MVIRKKRRIKKIIILVCIIAIIIAYIVAYMYLRSKAVKPDIRYYDKGTAIECGGYEFTVSAKMYTKEELMSEFDIEEYEMPGNDEYEYRYIVVDKNIKRISKEVSEKIDYDYKLTLYSRYWHIGHEITIEEDIQKDEYVYISNLEFGESTSMYNVYSISNCLLNEKLWDKVEETKVYYEFPGDKNNQYVSRVEVLN